MTTIRELRTKGKNHPNPTLRIPRGPLCIPCTSHTSFLSSLTPPCAHTHVQSRLAHSTGYLGQFSLRYPPGASPLPPAAGTRQVLDTCPWLEQPPPLCSLTSVALAEHMSGVWHCRHAQRLKKARALLNHWHVTRPLQALAVPLDSTSRNLFLSACGLVSWMVWSACSLQGVQTRPKPDSFWDACQVAFQKGHASSSCQQALAYDSIASSLCPVKRISFAKWNIQVEDCVWPHVYVSFHQTCMPFPLQFSLWLQSLENNYFSRSLTNIWLYFLLGFGDNLIFYV